MRIAIIAQEEPVYFSPFLTSIIKSRPDVVLVAIAGTRGAGNHPKTLKQRLEDLYSLWLIMEPLGFIRNICIGLWQKIIWSLGPLGFSLDRRSIQSAARKYNIPLIFAKDINSEGFIDRLKLFSPDIIINQTEILLKEKILSIPRIGVVNRHGSLLPHFRGRLCSFHSHAQEPPEYGITIHFVDKEIDSGPIIIQKKCDIDPCYSYAKVLDILFKKAAPLMLEALEKIEKPNFTTFPNKYQGTRTYLFPSLREVKVYRRTLRKRREAVAK